MSKDELIAEYHRKCDEHDAQVCSLDMGMNGVYPATNGERSKCIDNANMLRKEYVAKIPKECHARLVRAYPPV